MEQKKLPRVVIGGTASGSGKTTLTCALLGILKQKYNAVSYKCGPDYIDPMFHAKVLGVSSYNLDLFFCEKQIIKNLLAENKAEIAVIEGVMGFYDGMAINTEKGSTFDVANVTNSPVILTINAKGAANSLLATIYGFIKFKTNNIKGVVLNNITQHTYNALVPEIKKLGIQPLGYIPKLPSELVLESRHLGLKTAGEIQDIKQKLIKVAQITQQTLEIEKIIEIAQNAVPIGYEEINRKKICRSVNIAVAYDKAFCFYYKENLEILKQLGANLIFFSPLTDEKLPDNIQGIYLGGGYPELYTEQLSQNKKMRESILLALKNCLPCIAECGGFMYLTKAIDGAEMVGFLPTQSKNEQKLVRFGYVELTANNNNLLCKKGEKIKGHEFHYYDCEDNGSDFTAEKLNGKHWQAVYTSECLYAGYPHLSFLSNEKMAVNFIEKCAKQL